MSRTLLSLLLLAAVSAAAPPSLTVGVGRAPVGRGGYDQAPAARPFLLLGKGVPAAVQTEVRAALAGSRLHVLFECAEPDVAGLKTAARRSDGLVYEDDCVELFLAPVADRADDYFHFLVNAAGVGRDEHRQDERWNCGWRCGAERGTDRWWAWMSIPLEELDCSAVPGDALAANFTRERQASGELSSWSAMTNGFHDPQRFGRLSGVAGVGDRWAAASLRRQVAPLAAEAGRLRKRLPRFHSAIVEQARARLDDAERAAAAVTKSAAAPGAKAAGFEHLATLRTALDVARGLAERALLAPAEAAAFALTWASSMQKIRPQSPLSELHAGPVTLSAAGGEAESAQVVVVPLLQSLTGVTASASALKHGNVAIQPELRRVAYVDVKQASGGSRWGTGLWPDPLPPLTPFDLDKESVQPLWLTVSVPRDAPAGDYSGKLTVTAPGQPPAGLDVHLTVYGFALPPAARLRNVFQLGAGHIAKMHKLSALPGIPAGWHLGQWTGADVEGVPDYFGTADFSAERAEADGGHALRMTCANLRPGSRERPRQALHTEPIPLEPGAEYELSFRYRQTKGDRPAAGGYLPGFANPSLAPTAQWQTYRQRLKATAETKDTRVYVGIYDDGEVWYDDIRLVRVGTATDLLPAADFEAEQATLPEMLRRYRDLLLAYRCSDQNVAAPQITYAEDGRAVIDWTGFDQELERDLRLGLNAFNVSWAPLPGGWGTVAGFKDDEQVRRCRDVLAQTQAHLEARGWLDKAYLYVIDEPGAASFPQVRAAFELVGEAAPKLRLLLTFGYGATRPWKPGDAGEPAYAKLADVVDIFVPHSDCFDPRFLDTVRGKDNNEIWCYVCISAQQPYANCWQVDCPGPAHRVLYWQMLRERIEGFLYWNVTYWEKDPWQDPLTYPGGNGDGSMLYPGETGPVPSQRLAITRDALDDYDYVSLLRDAVAAAKGTAAQQAEARKLLDLSAITKSWTEYTWDAAVVEGRREAIGRLLGALR